MDKVNVFSSTRTLAWLLLGLALWAPREIVASAAPAPNATAAASEGRTLTNDFNSASQIFEYALNSASADLFAVAQRRFENFALTYTNSPLVPQAVLYQARSLLGQSNYAGALELLNARMSMSSNLFDHFTYWKAETYLSQSNCLAAAETFSNLNVIVPNSSLRMAAALGEARAFAKLSDWHKVAQLLGDENGVFQKAVRLQPKEDPANRGRLLLGQALYAQDQFAEAQKALETIDSKTLPADLGWQRDYWLCRVHAAGGHPEQALYICTNSLTLMAAGRVRETADTTSLRGEINEKLGLFNDAIEAYTNNLAAGIPADIQRHCLLKAVDLMLKLGQTNEASRRLDAFLQNDPKDAAADTVRLTLGELQLKAAFASTDPSSNAPSATNLLRQAQTNFSRLLLDFRDSPLRGKAWLDRGWCHWKLAQLAQTQFDAAQARAQIISAKADFSAAASRLVSNDQVVARFKLADSQYALGEYADAIANYLSVLRDSEHVPALESVFQQGLYQLLRANVANNDRAGSEAAVARIVERYQNRLSDECALLYGEFEAQNNRAQQARQTFIEMIQKFPNSPVRPDAEFAVARSYAQEYDWTNAAKQYDLWLTHYPNHTLLAQAQFAGALAFANSGNETNALNLFTNFVARFPTNTLAPWAQNWIADNYFNRGLFDIAEKAYSDVSDMTAKFPSASELGYSARLMAGRSAFARQGPKDLSEARKHFGDLINETSKDTNAPPALVAQAYFALGDTLFQQYREYTNATIDEVLAAFRSITNNAPNSTLAPMAKGRIGDCYYEFKAYTNALQCYQSVLETTNLTTTVKNWAEVRLALTYQHLDQPKEALIHFLNVIYGTTRDEFDAVGIKEAGVYASQLYEKQDQWAEAIHIYNRVLEAIPSLRPALEKKIANAAAHLENSKK